ncbi:alanine racemase [Roseomonas marmotae]|uniref:Alanine racemase n=2 Tax=Roseomonas marmotae TaxID=2768161 RepID=A0ABS3KE69_9PROT|nr:alanine racemase [Roseomonas marmotae]MBO1075717.1 alanine racemase [Roseomonas marmotae]QTI80862.1 alanine racemase [Roseomonas marmotae]
MMATEVPQAELEVDLTAITANWRDLAARHGAQVAGVVKADAYGLGAGPVARALAQAGCRHFFVAQFQEGLALREALGEGPMIAVLGGFPPGADPGAGLTPVLNGPADIAAWQAAPPCPAGTILHLDTGMERLGLTPAERAALPPGALDGLGLRYVMTHLACADEPGHPLNELQPRRFAEAASAFPGTARSLANSAGLFHGAAMASDLARPGCALYGINPTPGRPNPMRQVMRLTVPVLQVRQVAAGTSVGYGASWVAKRDSRIATIAAGYADGYLRALSSRGVGIFAGRPVPLVGRVSMDLITLDVTDIPDLRAGDRVEMIGPGQTPDDVAALAGTIGYEVLTSLGARYRRHYRPA